MPLRKTVAVLTALLALAGPAAAQGDPPIVGPAMVVDSDGLRIGGTTIMLWGVESVERPQTCGIGGVAWECFPAAVRALETIVGVSDVSCQPVGRPDGYGRVLAVCMAGDVNVNEALVRAGFALAKRDETLDYVAAEDAAKAERIGLWQGEFVSPHDFRVMRGVFQERP
jgi:endonuclease YncB( thermonuclease family)